MLESAVAALVKLCADPAEVTKLIEALANALMDDEPESAGPHLTELLRMIRLIEDPPG